MDIKINRKHHKREYMKTKHKRLIIIGACVAWGTLTIGYTLVSMFGSEDDFLFHICAPFNLPVILASPVLDMLGVGYGPIRTPLWVLIQIISYFFIGWIIARLIYPDKKASDKPETPQA